MSLNIGIMDKTILRPSLDAVLDTVVGFGIYSMQFGLGSAGLPELPKRFDPELGDSIHREFEARKMTMAAISGTYNMIHPDRE